MPIHPDLVKMGFLDFVAKQRRAKQIRLFPEIKAHSTTGAYSGTFTKTFAYFLKSIGPKEDKTVFHSFRHNFTDALRAAYVGRDHLRLLGGWSDGTSTEDLYGSGLPVELLADAINRTRFPVDLRHLHIVQLDTPAAVQGG